MRKASAHGADAFAAARCACGAGGSLWQRPNVPEAGELTDSIELAPGGLVVGLTFPISLWHTVRVLEIGTVIMKVKDGAYEPIGPEDIICSFSGCCFLRWDARWIKMSFSTSASSC